MYMTKIICTNNTIFCFLINVASEMIILNFVLLLVDITDL